MPEGPVPPTRIQPPSTEKARAAVLLLVGLFIICAMVYTATDSSSISAPSMPAWMPMAIFFWLLGFGSLMAAVGLWQLVSGTRPRAMSRLLGVGFVLTAIFAVASLRNFG